MCTPIIVNMYVYIYIYICYHPPPVPTFSLFCVLLVINNNRHPGCIECCTMIVPMRRCRLRLFVASASWLCQYLSPRWKKGTTCTASRAKADVDETLVHVAYIWAILCHTPLYRFFWVGFLTKAEKQKKHFLHCYSVYSWNEGLTCSGLNN